MEGKISCFGKDGIQREFTYNSSVSSWNYLEKHDFEITIDGDIQQGIFQFEVVFIDDDTIKIVEMHNNGHEDLSARGIPDSMIEEVSRLFEKEVISSTNADSEKIATNESRSLDADKFWERLVSKGFASYDQNRQVYVYQPTIQQA